MGLLAVSRALPGGLWPGPHPYPKLIKCLLWAMDKDEPKCSWSLHAPGGDRWWGTQLEAILPVGDARCPG